MLCLSVLSGCVNHALTDARTLYYQGNYIAASDALTTCDDFAEKEKFLCLVEKGTVLHDAGEFRESNRFFLEAHRFIQDRDYISISQQTTASIINDYAIVYVGEYSEQLWIHSYLMMNFLQLGDYISARVEAKRALEVFERHPEALEDDYYTRGLIALCFELFGQFDSARIEYDIVEKNSGSQVSRPGTLPADSGELVLMIGTGRGPVKVPIEIVVPPTTKISIPHYRSASPFHVPRIQDADKKDILLHFSTDTFEVSDKSLSQRMAEIISRQTVRVAGKEAIADSFRNDRLAEFLVRVALFATEHADVRSWQTLPRGFHLYRLSLPAGSHQLRVSLGEFGAYRELPVTLTNGERVFKSLRL